MMIGDEAFVLFTHRKLQPDATLLRYTDAFDGFQTAKGLFKIKPNPSLAQIVVPSTSAAEMTFSDFPSVAEKDIRIIDTAV